MPVLSFHTVMDGNQDNGAKAYECIVCGSFIAHSDEKIPIGGKTRHFFVNPSRVECDFHAFSACPGAVVAGEATEAHTWFPGYRWRLAFCGHCGQHMGWRYEAVLTDRGLKEFWGILVNHLIEVERNEGPGELV